MEYLVRVGHIFLEKNVDILKYTYEDNVGQNTTVYIDGEEGKETFLTLFAYSSGKERHYFWEFELDGSLPSFGSQIEFSMQRCYCIEKSITCTEDNNNQPSGIMNSYTSVYCGNLHCKFLIEPCMTKNKNDVTVLQLNIKRTFYDMTMQVDGNLDIFTVYSDGVVALNLEIDTFNNHENDYILFLNNSQTHYFEAITYPSRISKQLFLKTNRLTTPPSVFYVSLTLNEPIAVIDTGLYYLNVIKVQNFQKNESIVIYSNTVSGIPIFEDENLMVNYKSRRCFGNMDPLVCKITKNEFAIYVPDMYLPYPFLIIQSANFFQKGCVFNRNTFIIKHVTTLPIAIVASSNDDCIARVSIIFDNYKPNYYYISSYWTNSRDENVKIFAGTDILYFEFSSKTSKRYTRIELFSLFYTIKVPKNSAIYLQLNEVVVPGFIDYDGLHVPQSVNILINYISMFASPYYGTSKGKQGFTNIIYCFPFRKVKFTTIYYETSTDEDFYFVYKNVLARVEENGEILIFDNRLSKNSTSNLECVDWIYSPKGNNYPATNGIIFVVETVDDI